MTNSSRTMLTLTYYGAKWMPHYNVIGRRQSRIGGEHLRYLAADLRGERQFASTRFQLDLQDARRFLASAISRYFFAVGVDIMRLAVRSSPSRRSATARSIFCRQMSRGVTGEIVHVDAGYHVVGMENPAAPDLTAVKD